MSTHAARVSSSLRARLPRWLRSCWLGHICLLERWRLWCWKARTGGRPECRRPTHVALEVLGERTSPTDVLSLLHSPLGAGGLALAGALQTPLDVLGAGWQGDAGGSGSGQTLIPAGTTRKPFSTDSTPPDEASLAALFSAWQNSQGTLSDGLAAGSTSQPGSAGQADGGDQTDSFANPFAAFLKGGDGQQAAGQGKPQQPRPAGTGQNGSGGGGGGGGGSLTAGTVHGNVASFHQPGTGQAIDPVTASEMTQGSGTPAASGAPTDSSTGAASTAPTAGASTPSAQPAAATAPGATTGTGGTSPVADASAVLQNYGQTALPFEVNVGQTDPSVNFLSHGPGFELFLSPSGATFSVPVASQNAAPAQPGDTATAGSQESFAFQLAGANANPTIKGINLLSSRSNYYLGSDPSQWLTDVENYGGVEYDNVYNGVNLIYNGTSARQMEYTFAVQPGADASAIKMNWQGVQSESIDSAGNIDLQTAAGTIVVESPTVYQMVNGVEQAVSVQQVQTGLDQTGFQLGGYNASLPVLIDPTLSYSSYLGGSGADYGYGVAVDGAGDAYVTGSTHSTSFPGTLGFGSLPGSGTTDAFVTKLNAAGTGIVYSDYLGTSVTVTSTQGNGIAVDLAGNAYVVGTIAGQNLTGFATTPNAYLSSISSPGPYTAFVSKISAAGDSLDYSTLLGMTYGTVQGNAIAVDASGEAYVTGVAMASMVNDPFPTSPGAYLATVTAGQSDAFVSKFNAAGSTLVYSTLLGSTSDTRMSMGNGIALDGAGDAYVTGQTTSASFPLVNAFETSKPNSGASITGFVTEMNPTGTGLMYSSYLGGSGSDQGNAIAVDRAGNAYLTGQTTSSNFPTLNPLQSSLSGSQDAFVTKVAPGGGTLVYSTYLGGSSSESGHGIAVDQAGEAFVTGLTASSSFPTTSGAMQTSKAGGGNNAFITKLNAAGSTLAYSSYLGGSGGDDEGRGVAVDPFGNAYLTGFTNSNDFPTVSPVQPHNGSSPSPGYDAFIAEVLPTTPPPAFTGISPDTGTSSTDRDTSSQHISLTGTAAAGATVTLYQEGVGLIGTTTASTGGTWTYNDTGTTLPEGVAAFYATATVGGITSVPTQDYLVTVDLTAPAVAVSVPATTASLAPQVRVTASDLNGLPNGTTVTLDVDLRNDGTFTDPGDSGYATGTLTDGVAVITLSNASYALSLGSTYRVEARVADVAGNQGTSAAQSFQVTSVSSPWQPSYQVVASDPTQGDATDQLGDVSLSHPLDLDQSPGTSQSGDAQLVYNSDWANVQPVVQVTLPSDNSMALPANITAQLTFNGVTGPTQTYLTTGLHPGDVLSLSQQASSALATSGAYSWSMTVKVNYSTPLTYTFGGTAYVVSESGSAFGSGWTLSTVDQLIAVSGGELRAYGSGGWSYYASAGGNNYTSPVGDNGTLTGNSSSGWTYTTPDGQTTSFNASGQQTGWSSPDGQETLQYRWTGSQLTGMTAIDGAIATFTYTGGQLSGIQTTNGRSWTLSNGGSGTNLVSITDPDGGVRTFSYDSSHHLTVDDFAGLQNEYAYSGSGGLATMTWGSPTGPGSITNQSVTGYSPVLSQGLNTLVLGAVWASQTNADGHTSKVLLDSQGRVLQSLTANGGLTQDTYTNGYLTSETDALGNTTTYTRDAQGYLTLLTNPDGSTEQSQYQSLFHALTTYTDERGDTTTYAYDSSGHLTGETDALGNTTGYGYLANGLLQTETTARGYTTTYAYDGDRRLASTTDPYNNVTTYAYDANGNPSTTTDANGNVTTTTDDNMGRQTNTQTPLGYLTTVAYSKAGLELSATDALGDVTSLVYDGFGRGQLLQTLAAYGTAVQGSTLASYDAAGLSSGSRDADGWWTNNSYDPNGRLAQATNAQGGVSMNVYDLDGQVTASRDARGGWTKEVYNNRGWVVQQADALGNVTTNAYDQAGDLTSSTDPLGYVSSTVYNKVGQVSVSYDARGNATTTTYDQDNNVATVTMPNGTVSSYLYDKNDRQIALVEAVGTGLQRTTSTGYDKVGNVVTQTDALGRVTTTSYDKDNRAVTSTDPLNEVTTTVYDANDEVVATVNALSQTSTTVYNQLGQQVASIDPYNHVTSSILDGNGQQVGSIDALGDVSVTINDALGQNIGSVDGAGNLTQLRYDLAGNTAAEIDPDGNRTSYVTDAGGRRVQTTDARGDVGSVVYNGDGQVTSQTDADGRTITYSYNKNGQETGETWLNSSNAVVNVFTFTYDSSGNETAAANNAGTDSTTPDALNRVASTTDVHGVTLTYTYNALDQVTGVQDSLGGMQTSVYNQAGELTSRQQTASGEQVRIDPGYDSAGEMTSLTRYADVGGTSKVGSTTLGYDNAGRLTSITSFNGSGATLSYYDYGYNSGDQVSTASWHSQVGTVVFSGSHTYSYDGSGQLLSDGTTTYSYDSNGNRTMTGYQTGTNNQLTNDGTWTYTYDQVGNRTQKSKGAGLETWYYGYDNANELTSVKQTSNGTTVLLQVTYVYDALHNRVEQDEWTSTTGTVVTRFAYDAENVIADTDASNNVLSRYVYGDQTDQILARLIPTGQTNAGVYYDLTDDLGSVVDIMASSQSVVDHIDYTAYGGVQTESNPNFGSRFMYTGREFDNLTGLQFNRHRYYDPATGMWSSQDSLGFSAGDANLYRYVENNPTGRIDPEGAESWNVNEAKKTVTLKITVKVVNGDQNVENDGSGEAVLANKMLTKLTNYINNNSVTIRSAKGDKVFSPKIEIIWDSKEVKPDFTFKISAKDEDFGMVRREFVGTSSYILRINKKAMQKQYADNPQMLAVLRIIPERLKLDSSVNLKLFLEQYLNLRPAGNDVAMSPLNKEAGVVMMPRFYQKWLDKMRKQDAMANYQLQPDMSKPGDGRRLFLNTLLGKETADKLSNAQLDALAKHLRDLRGGPFKTLP